MHWLISCWEEPHISWQKNDISGDVGSIADISDFADSTFILLMLVILLSGKKSEQIYLIVVGCGAFWSLS